MFWRKNDAISEYLKYLYHCEYLEKNKFSKLSEYYHRKIASIY